MAKHPRSPSLNNLHIGETKKSRMTSNFSPVKIATAEAAAAVDADPPLPKLLKAVGDGIANPAQGESVVYWMRMGDLRVNDNRALSRASAQATKDRLPLVVLFILSPQDYIAHDRGARRIDFTLRNLAIIRGVLNKLHIPLHTVIHPIRRTLPSQVISFSDSVCSTTIYANIEYEIDELRRDIAICKLAKEKGMKVNFIHDKCVIEPGVIQTKQHKTYTVFSPYQRMWTTKLNGNISHYLDENSYPQPNQEGIRNSKKFCWLFETEVPSSLPGFELMDVDKKNMEEVWPAGETVASQMLDRFLHTKVRSSQLGSVNPLAPDAEKSPRHSRIAEYNEWRNRADKDTSSRLSPYLSAGIISARACIRATMSLRNSDKVDTGGGSSIGTWVQEIVWRDFYTEILVAFPRVSMGRPFLEKYTDVVWEDNQEDTKNGENGSDALQRWKEGRTGYPIVDAAMRCLNEMGWVHNRLRMISAMFLTKDLMIDWRVGERHFMQQLVDGDLASNNGGWQWSASTGTDAAPYFRIFNPYSQSTKADPSGDFIRHFVPELAKLKGPDVHNPPASTADKLGYPRPIIEHDVARERALRRFKNPGTA